MITGLAVHGRMDGLMRMAYSLRRSKLHSQICTLCGCAGEPSEQASIRSNIRKFRDQKFMVWRCRECVSLHCEEVENISSYYENYTLHSEDKLNYFANAWFSVILRRLENNGLTKKHSMLDYGCGTGLFLDYLRGKGYNNCTGYDAYVSKYKQPSALSAHYDVVVSFDVIEHVESPKALIQTFENLLKPGGLLCIQTPRADGIDLSDPEEYIHILHMPYHIHILSERVLLDLCGESGFLEKTIFRRWFRDSWLPGTSRRFFETFMKAHGNDMESAFDPPKWSILLGTPALWYYALFGYFFPKGKQDNMMVMLKKHSR